jgi:hypothetical protein
MMCCLGGLENRTGLDKLIGGEDAGMRRSFGGERRSWN